MVGDEHVDDVVDVAGHDVDDVSAAHEPVGGVLARVERRPQLVADGDECRSGLGRDAPAGLDVQHDVDVVGGSDDA
ncbi:MAG TPA: hypothetical protein VGE77_12160, partial [Nocardioides sp.]